MIYSIQTSCHTLNNDVCYHTAVYYVLSLCGSNSEGTIYVLLKFPVKLRNNNERTCYTC